jgi:hypothetical protein
MNERFGIGSHELVLSDRMPMEITLEDMGPRTGVHVEVFGRSRLGLPCAITILPGRTNGYPMCGAGTSHPDTQGRVGGAWAKSFAEVLSNRNQISVCLVGDDFAGTLVIKPMR